MSNRYFIYQPSSRRRKQDRFGDSVVSSYTFPDPGPLVSISTSVVVDRTKDSYDQGTPSNHAFKRHTITFTGYFINPTATPGPATANYILGQHAAIRNVLQKDVDIDVNDADGSLLQTFTHCNPISVDLEEGTYANYGRYTVVFECEDVAQSSDIIEYSWDFSIQENTDMGYFESNNHTPASNSYVTGTETITVTALNVEDAKTFVLGKIQFNGNNSVYLTGDKIYDVLNQGTMYNVCNLTYNSSVDVTTATVTYVGNFILVPNGKSTTVLGTLNLSNSKSSGEIYPKGVCAGSLKGISAGVKISDSDLTSNAITAYAAIKGQAKTKVAQYVTGSLNDTPLTENVTRNFGAGTVDFNLEYDTRSNREVANVIYEKIEITEHPTRDVHAVIPVMGRASGPILQDTYAQTEKKKDFSIEVVYKAGYGGADGPGTLSVENSHKPAGNIIFESAASTMWNSSERRFVRQKSWVYE